MFLKKLVLVVAVTALVGSAMAQGGGGRRGGQRGGGNPNSLSSLIRRADVQKDLGITDDQKAKITDIQTSAMQRARDAATAAGDDRTAQQAARAKVTEDAGKEQMAVLTADQVKRLKEIFVQVRGPQAVLNPEIQTDLGISEDQKAKIKDLQARETKANQEIQAKVADQSIDRAEATTERQKNTQVLADEIAKVLTDDQKSKLKDMSGKPFTADPPPAGRGGGK